MGGIFTLDGYLHKYLTSEGMHEKTGLTLISVIVFRYDSLGCVMMGCMLDEVCVFLCIQFNVCSLAIFWLDPIWIGVVSYNLVYGLTGEI